MEKSRKGGRGIRKKLRDKKGRTVLAEERENGYAVSYVTKMVECGKASQDTCRKCRQGIYHGPYIYKVYRKPVPTEDKEVRNTVVKTEYIGPLSKAEMLQQEGRLPEDIDF